MAQYDGSIRIGTGIDKKGFQAGSKELEAGARRLAKSVSDSLGEGAKIALQKQTDAFIKLNQQYAAQEQKVKDLAGKLHDMQRQKVETAEFKELSKDLDKAKASLDRLYTSRDSYVELGKKTPPKLELDISDAERKVRILEADIKELISADKAYLPVDTSKIKQDIASAEQKQMQIYSALQNSAETLGLKIAQNVEKEEIHKKAIQEEAAEEERLAQIRENAVVGNQRIIETIERIKELEQEIADLKSVGVTEGYEDYDSRIQKLAELRQEVNDYNNGIDEARASYRQLGEAATDALKKLSKSIYKYAISPFISLGKIAAKTFLGIGKSAKSSNNMLNKGFKAILKYGLGIRSLYILINKLRTGIKEGFSNLYNDKNMAAFKAQVDSLKASLLTLKNSFAAAFRPIVEIAIPYIQKLIDYITSLLNVVGQFMAAITGQKNYTKAIKQTTAAIEDQNKAQNKQLSGLDKLNNLTSSSGGGAAGTGTTDMFEEVPIEDKWKDMAQKLKDMWKESDFYDLGKSIGEWLKNALDSIPWNEIKEKARKLGKSLATLINGFIEVEGLGYSIGRTLAEAFNTAFEFLNAFVHELHWKSLGKFIADTLNGIFENIDWELIRDTFVTGFNGLADAINSFIDNFHWDNISNTISNAINIIAETVYTFFSTVKWGELGKNLGEQLMESIKKIDWEQLGRAIGSVIQAALDFVTSFIGELDFGEVAQAVVDALKGFFETVDMEQLAEVILAALTIKLAAKATASVFNIAAGAILSALGSAIKGATAQLSSLGTTILSAISSGIAGAGGIANSLTLDVTALIAEGGFATAGVAIGTAIIGGVVAAIGGFHIGQWLNKVITGEEIDMSWAEQFDEIKNSFSDGSWKGALKLWWDDIYNAFVNFGEWQSQVVGEWIEAGKNLINGIKDGISEAISGIGSWINEHIFQPFINGFKNLFGIHSPSTVMMELGKYIIQGLLDGITSLVDKVKETWESMKETALEVWENVKTGLSEKWESMKESATTKWTEIKENLNTTWNTMKTTAETNFSAIRDYIAEKWADTESNTDSTWGRIKETVSSIASDVRGVVSSKFSEILNSFGGFSSDAESSWANTWENIKNKLGSILSSIKDAVSSAFNWISDKIVSIGSAISGAFSGGGGAATYSGVMTYSAMPQMAALSKMEFPGYATGQVIPTSMKKHLAWLGDNNHETEVVSPISTIKEALLEGLVEAGLVGGSTPKEINLTIPVVINDKEVAKAIQKIDLEQFKRTGKGLFAY